MTHPKDLRSRRLALGLSHSELAKVLGVRAALIGRWERGEVPIEDADSLFARLDALLRDREAEPIEEPGRAQLP